MPMAQNDRTKSNPSILGVRFCLFSGICFVVFILIFVSVDSNAVKIRHYLHNYKKRNNDNEEDFSAKRRLPRRCALHLHKKKIRIFESHRTGQLSRCFFQLPFNELK